MHKKPISTQFKFILTEAQLFSNLDHLKLHNYEHFLKIGKIGKQIQALSKADQVKQLQQLVDKNFFDLQFMKLEIEDAFVSALHLRNEDVVRYFLENGIQIDRLENGCVIEVCYSLEYLRHDPPVELLRLVLEFGGDARYAAEDGADTGMHVAARYGNVEFMKLLLEYGADINAVNDEKMTPLGCAISSKQTPAINFLKSLNASTTWHS